MIHLDFLAYLFFVTCLLTLRRFIEYLLKTKHDKHLKNISRSSIHASLYCKLINETLVGRPLCNSSEFENKEWDKCKTTLLIIL